MQKPSGLMLIILIDLGGDVGRDSLLLWTKTKEEVKIWNVCVCLCFLLSDM